MENFVAMRLNQSVTAKTLVGGLFLLARQVLLFLRVELRKTKSIDTLVDIIKNTLNTKHNTVL